MRGAHRHDNLSDLERREATKRERADDVRKSRDNLLEALQKRKTLFKQSLQNQSYTTVTDKPYDVLHECVTQHMSEDGMTEEEATEWCEKRLGLGEYSAQKRFEKLRAKKSW